MTIEKEWTVAFREYVQQFVELTDEEWLDLTLHIKAVKLKKKEYFVKPGNEKFKLGFIIKGILRTFFISEDAEEYTTDFCTDNEISVNYGISASEFHGEYYSQAVEESLILDIDYDYLVKSGETNEKWKILQSKIIEYYYPRKVERENSLLSMSAEKRYVNFIEKYSSIIDKIPQFQIASYLGITPIALSRIRKKMQNINLG